MQAAVLYYRTTKHHTHIAAWQFIELAGGLAEDIGIGGPQRPPSLSCPAGGPYIDSSEAWRTWLVCHMLSATLALFMRKPNPSNWDHRDSQSLEMMEYSYFKMDTDELLGQHIRAERLCDVIATEQCLYDNAPTVDITEPAVQTQMRRLADSITDWTAQIPRAIDGPEMRFWENVAHLYMHEPVLHTPTNKSSFAAPFIAPRISVTDFPKPLVCQEHIISIYKIKDCAHAVLDVFGQFDAAYFAAMPAMYFPGRVAYAMYLLGKLYVAATAPGNTFGAFLDPDSLMLEVYLEKMMQMHARVAAIDEWCGQARILSASFKMREWFQNYRTKIAPSLEVQSTSQSQISGYDTVPTSGVPLMDQWSTMPHVDDTQALGLEEFFADPMLNGWFPQQFDQPSASSSGVGSEHTYL